MSMSKDEFIGYIIASLSPDYRVSVTDVQKVGGGYTGLVIKGLNDGSDVDKGAVNTEVGATFNLDELYKSYTESGKESIAEVADKIIQMFENNKIEMSAVRGLKIDRDYILANVVERLSPVDKVPDKIFMDSYLDLAVVYSVRCNVGGSNGCFNLTKDHLNNFNISVDEIREAARNNRSNREFEIEPLWKILSGMGFPAALADDTLYVASSKDKYFGASIMLDEKCFETFSDEKIDGGDFIVVPSSVHEVLCMKQPINTDNTKDIEKIIRSVNADVVAENEQLGDHPYIYCREKNCIMMPEDYLKLVEERNKEFEFDNTSRGAR